MTFMVICIIIMFNILFGIVIDTFAQLRDKKSFTDLDMKNICYICAIDRSTVRSNRVFLIVFLSLTNTVTASINTSPKITTCGSTSSTLYISRVRTTLTTQELSPT